MCMMNINQTQQLVWWIYIKLKCEYDNYKLLPNVLRQMFGYIFESLLGRVYGLFKKFLKQVL
jgi:hypothetical protein